MLHPKLQNAQFRDDRVDADGHHLPRRDIAQRGDLDFEQAGVVKFTFRIRKDLSRCVAASDGRGEEPEFRRAAGNKAELLSLDQQFRAFLHALRDDTQRLYRRLVAGNSGHGGLQANVIGPSRPRLDAYALASDAMTPVDRGASCDGEIRLETLQFADWLPPVPISQ